MKKVIRYLLEGDGSIPKFVEDGGYFPLGEEMVGISVDEDKRHLPLSVVRLTRQQILDRYTAMNPHDHNGEPLSTQEIQEAVENWLSSKGLADYV